jgi:hypothetical protein
MYVIVKKGIMSYPQALANGLRAIDLEPENIGICQDVAQLMAWWEDNKSPSLDLDAMSILKKITENLSYSKEYTKAYKIAKDGYGQLDIDKQSKKKEADEVIADAKKFEMKCKQLNETLRAKGKAYDAAIRRIDTINDQINRSQDELARSTDYRQRDNINNSQRNLQQQLKTARSDADKLLSDGKDMRKEADDTKKDWEIKKDHASKLQRMANSADDLPTCFGWVPPAVDGIITPDLTVNNIVKIKTTSAPVKNSYLAPVRVATSFPSELSLDELAAEAEAKDLLDLAKIGLNSKDINMRTMAQNNLAKIVKFYNKTKSFSEAKLLIEKL